MRGRVLHVSCMVACEQSPDVCGQKCWLLCCVVYYVLPFVSMKGYFSNGVQQSLPEHVTQSCQGMHESLLLFQGGLQSVPNGAQSGLCNRILLGGPQARHVDLGQQVCMPVSCLPPLHQVRGKCFGLQWDGDSDGDGEPTREGHWAEGTGCSMGFVGSLLVPSVFFIVAPRTVLKE